MNLRVIRERYPWPDVPAGIQPYIVSLDGGGRHLVDALIEKDAVKTMLEIGSFLGGSTHRWLACSPNHQVIAVDPWNFQAGDYVASEQSWFYWPRPPDNIVHQLNASDGLYHTFLANLAGHRERLIPVRANSPEVLEELKELGLQPDLIYIDADKERDDLEACHRFWPTARLTGDDYMWNAEAGFPMQQIVHAFASDHGYVVIHDRATWVLQR